MRILITGAGGFLGTAITEECLRRGFKVAGLFRRQIPVVQKPGLECLFGTLENPPWLQIERFRPTSAIHCAWITTPGLYWNSPLNHHFANVSLEFALKLEQMGVEHFSVLGTCAEYKWNEELCIEDSSQLEPESIYGWSKLQLRKTLRHQLVSMKLAWCRIFFPYGPGEPEEKLMSMFLKSFRSGRLPDLINPKAVRDYIYIDDLATAVTTVCAKRFTGDINIGTGLAVSLEEICRLAASITGTPFEKCYSLGSTQKVVADVRRLTGLGWTPKTDLKNGVVALKNSLFDCNETN